MLGSTFQYVYLIKECTEQNARMKVLKVVEEFQIFVTKIFKKYEKKILVETHLLISIRTVTRGEIN